MIFPPVCHRFQAQVDRSEISIGADEWPMFLYDEDMYDPKKEWTGLFLGETFVHMSPSIYYFFINTHNSLRCAYVSWSALQQHRTGHMAYHLQEHTPPQIKKGMLISMALLRSLQR